jgi:hypothetical protein
VNYLFNVQMHQQTADIALARANGGSAVAEHARVTILYAERCPDSDVSVDATTTAFGRAVQALHFQRRTLSERSALQRCSRDLHPLSSPTAPPLS